MTPFAMWHRSVDTARAGMRHQLDEFMAAADRLARNLQRFADRDDIGDPEHFRYWRLAELVAQISEIGADDD